MNWFPMTGGLVVTVTQVVLVERSALAWRTKPLALVDQERMTFASCCTIFSNGILVLSLTVTTALAVLLAGTGSPTADETVTTFVNFPSRIVRAVMVAVAEVWLAMVPRLKVMTPLAN